MDKRKIIKTKVFESVREEVIAAGGEQEWSNYMIQGLLLHFSRRKGRLFKITFTDSTYAFLTT